MFLGDLLSRGDLCRQEKERKYFSGCAYFRSESPVRCSGAYKESALTSTLRRDAKKPVIASWAWLKAAARSSARARFFVSASCSRRRPVSSISTPKEARNSWSAIGVHLHRPRVVLPPDPDQLRRVQEVVQSIGPVPEFVLPPEVGGDREEEQFVDVRTGYGEEAGGTGGEFLPPSPKKSARVKETSSSVRRKQVFASCRSSGYPQSSPVMTGFGPAGRSTST